jgi:two-component system, NtrC family, response regulator AtoC
VAAAIAGAINMFQPSGGARPSNGAPHDLPQWYEQLFRRSERMRAVERLVLQTADTTATVLIQGETGVGKELVAKTLHHLSSRSSKPWLKVNCASLPPELLESELFGHEKGAFTGAVTRKPGRFELAHRGTLLLDEIGEMPLGLQAKLLHVLQDNEFFRVGGQEAIRVDVRVIAASNRDLAQMAGDGAFRWDLYHRLNVVRIAVPPLRERREEIPLLVAHFREQFSREYHRQSAPLSEDTLALLERYDWVGNVRELENLLKRYVVLGDESHLREEMELRLRLASPDPRPANRGPRTGGRTKDSAPPAAGALVGSHLDEGLRELGRRAAEEAERAAIAAVLERVRWNRAEAARLLKISYKTLLWKIDKMGFGRAPRGTSRHRGTTVSG